MEQEEPHSSSIDRLVGVGKKKFKWTEVHQEAFEDIKIVMTRKSILNYLNSSEIFKIHIYSSDIQLGVVSSQGEKPLKFRSRKLSNGQSIYIAIEQEIFSIMKILTDFRNIL